MLPRIAIGLLAGTLISAPAWAQTTAPAQPPAPATQNQGATMVQGTAQGGNVQYVTQNRPDLWRASRLEGLSVYNNNNEKIGDISEVLVNRQGQVEAVVIGVGGFLGIGERHVAVPFTALQWQQEPARTAATTTTTTTTTAPVTTGTATQPTTGTTAGTTAATPPATTGTTAGTTAATPPATTGATGTAGTMGTARTDTRMASAGDEVRDYPERAILPNATKAQLESAPEFRYAR